MEGAWRSVFSLSLCCGMTYAHSNGYSVEASTQLALTNSEHRVTGTGPVVRLFFLSYSVSFIVLSNMENPIHDIPAVVHLLTQTPPSVQRDTLEHYFTPNAAFTHPFCRVESYFPYSRALIRSIFRWYKIMSPRIQLSVHSVAFDQPNNLLYVGISQRFAIWFVPLHRTDVQLVTVLELEHQKSNGKYYIKSQNDLYQTDQFVKFVLPYGGPILVWLWQTIATLSCVLLALLFWPLTAFEEYMHPQFTAKKKK